MPIKFKKYKDDIYYFQWGNRKKYYCDINKKSSIEKAHAKVIKQMKAIYSSEYSR